MEKRHYFEIPDTLVITSLKRTFTGNNVTGYTINTTNYAIQVSENYQLLVTLPVNQPLKGIIAYSDADEIWTSDGLYLHKGGAGTTGNIAVYIKDFLESIPDSYQAKLINEITLDNTKLNTIATYLVNNTPVPKEFNIIYNTALQQGTQDQIVAYVSTVYYVNSSNDYVPYQSTNMYGSTWAIPNTVYDSIATSNNIISNGIRKDMILKSNKLVYLMRYEGMLVSDTVPYLQKTSGSLVYLNNVTVDGLGYQVYMNPKYLYNSSGLMVNPLAEAVWQTIVVEDAFLHENLRGKVLKVW